MTADAQAFLDDMRARRVFDALQLIAGDACENFTEAPGACTRTARTPDAPYSADRWCKACVAWRALHGGPAIAYADGRVLAPGAVRFEP